MNKIWGAEIYVEERIIDIYTTRLHKDISSAYKTKFELLKKVRSIHYIFKL